MLEKLTSWILCRNSFIEVDTEELSALDLIGKIANKTNETIDAVNNMLTTGIQQPLRDALTVMALSGELQALIQELVILDGGTF